MPATAQLILRVGSRVVRTIPLHRSPFRIGRNPDNTLPMQHQLVSREHAELKREAQGWTVTDLQSANGTFVDNTRLLPNQPRLLASGASIRVGPFELLYEVVPDVATNGADHGGDPVATPAPAEAVAATPSAAPEPPAAPPMTATTLAEPLPAAEPVPAQPAPAIYSGDKLCAPVRLLGDTLLPPRDAPSRYLRYLPIMFHDADFLRRYLLIFESIWEPHEDRQSHIEMYFDARTAPAPFLGWLAGWLGLALNAHWPEARRRHLLAEAMNLYRWRGTSYGLARMIEVCTGLTPDISDGPPLDPFVFRVRMTIPTGSDVDPEFVEDLIRMHKPAHAGYILELRA